MKKQNAQPLNVDQIRADFPVLKRLIRGKPLVYLDTAASALKPQSVIDRIAKYYSEETSNVHRAAHFLAEQGTINFEAARETVRGFLNATDKREIIFTRGTTESVNLVASAWGDWQIESGDEIILSELEHHSNIIPWQMLAQRKGATLKIVAIDENGELDYEQYLQLLSKRTKIIALTLCSNVLGSIVPIKKFAAAARSAGSAKIFVDAAQAVPHFAVNVNELDCDFLAFSGHKLYGPFGIGVLYSRLAILEAMPPYQTGGSQISQVTWEKTTWAEVPHKFEAGTPNIPGALGLATAIQYVQRLGLDSIHAHSAELLAYATSELQTVSNLRIFGNAREKSAIISFAIDGVHASDLGTLLDQQGVAIRTGHHCCQPLMKRLGVSSTARASFSIYNTPADVNRLKACLMKAKEFF